MVTLREPGLYNRPLVEATRYSFARRLPAAYRAEVDAHRMPLAAYVHTGRWPVLPERPQQFAARQQTGLELLGPPRRWGGRLHQREARPDLSTTVAPTIGYAQPPSTIAVVIDSIMLLAFAGALDRRGEVGTPVCQAEMRQPPRSR